MLIPALLALPYMPDSVRTLLPEAWRSHIPRVEFLHDARRGGGDLGAADSAKINESSAMAGGFSLDAVALEQPEERKDAQPIPPSPIRRSPRAARRTLPPDEAGEPEDLEYMPDHAVSMIPSRIQTEIRLASAATREGAHSGHPAPSRAEGYADQDWPVLCAQVVDESGAPVGDAQVELESPRLTVSTDAHGRFCLACPVGTCTVRIEAPGRGRATRIIALEHSLYEMRITLSQRH